MIRPSAIRVAVICLLGPGLGACASIEGSRITSNAVAPLGTGSGEWWTYSGAYSGQQHSQLKQITDANVTRLSTVWEFDTGSTGRIEATPLAVDGRLYFTGPNNEAWALDSATGRVIWKYSRQLPTDLRLCCGRVNRGFAIRGRRLFMATLDAHLVAIDIDKGNEVWTAPLANYRIGHSSTGAPLVIDRNVIVGISGGEFGIRGFVDAYDAETGERVWRFWTVPGDGEPGNDSWPPEVWKRGGGGTWVTGTYDPKLQLIYWGTGNPSPPFFGGERAGDNLYTAALIALDAMTGKLKWHFQFTPHDTRDWGSNHVPVLADLAVNGRLRSVVVVANRNGFVYVLDRLSGELISAKPFVKATWAKEIAARGRPVPAGSPESVTCPDLHGATNYMSPSLDPSLKLLFVQSRETCMSYFGEPEQYTAGLQWMGGFVRAEGNAWGALRALDVSTGRLVWERKHDRPLWAGVLSTAGGVVVSADAKGNVEALASATGRRLWHFAAGAPMYSAPISYMVRDRQHILVSTGAILRAFALNP